MVAFGLALLGCSRTAPPAGATISPQELARRIEDGTAPLVLDVRTEQEFTAGHVPGSLNIPYDQLAERLSELPISSTGEVVVHCEGGGRAARAEEILIKSGYTRVLDLEGHMKGWREAGLPVATD